MRKVNSYYSYLFVSLVCIGILASHCTKDKSTETPIDLGYNYFPDDVGRYIIYEVDSITQDDPVNFHDTTRYLLKEVIAATFLDNSGRTTLRIERFYKIYSSTIPYDSMNWTGQKVWTVNRTQSTLEKKEENITYLKLVFPVREGKQWNGNAYNTLGQKDYEIISVDQPETINNINFDSVLTVRQFEQINIIEYRYELEKYARNIGLVFKQSDSLSIQQQDVNDDIPYDDTVGYTFTQKIVSYGK